MKKTMLAASLTAALCLMISNSYAREIPLTTSTELKDITQGELIDDNKGSTAYYAQGHDTLKGENKNIDLTIKGDWFGAFLANGADKSWEISNLNNLSIDFNNPNLKPGSTGLQAVNGADIYLHDIADISITNSQQESISGSPDAIPIHAQYGSIRMDEVGDVTIKSLEHGNAIMVQASESNNGLVDINSSGDIYVESKIGCAIQVGLIASGTNDSSKASLSLRGKTITVKSNWSALQVYDKDGWGGSGLGTTDVKLIADEKITLDSSDYGVIQGRQAAEGSSSLTIQAPSVNIHGDSSAISTLQLNTNSGASNGISINSKTVNLTSDGTKSVATLDLAKNGTINFENTFDSTRSQINITASKGNSVNVAQDANLNFTNADVNVQQGNVTGTGTVALEGSTLNLAENVTMNMNSVQGKGAQIVFNTAQENAVQINETNKSVSVLASGDLNDRYGAEALNFINAEGATTGAQAGKVRGAIVELADGSHAVQENTAMKALEQMNASTLVQFRLENNRLSQRLGEVRDNLNKAGGWARVYGAKSRLSDSIDSTIKTNSIQVGADATVGSNWIVGGAFSYTNMDADFSNGNGDSDSYMLSAYASGFFDCGGYIDVIGRVGRMSTDLYASSGANVEAFDGSYDNTAFGLSTEVGYHWKLSDVFFVEPQAELAYGYVLGDDYTASNDVKVEQDDFQSLVGRLGTRLGAAFPKDAGIIYAHASVNHDFLGNNDFTAQAPGMTSALKFSNDLDETWISYGIGLQLNPSKNFYVYGSLDRASGSEYAESYHYSVGARYVF